MIIHISDIWQLAEEEHAEFLTNTISENIKTLSNPEQDLNIRRFIDNNQEIIINGKPAHLIQSIDNYKRQFQNESESSANSIKEKLKTIFDYEGFSKKSNAPWTAYKLCNKAKYQTCSYCQLIFTGTCLPDEENKGYRPPIDHYYGKAEYPFLALTLSNLIPCCEKCNGSQMKGTIDFSTKQHLNPLADDESIDFLLATNTGDHSIAEEISLNLPKESYMLKLVANSNITLSNRSLKTFQLQRRYNDYSGPAYHLAKVMRGVSKRIKNINEALEFDVSLEDYLEFEPEQYRTVAYGKARLCIAKQFGAI